MNGGTVIFTHGDCDGICSGALALAAHRDAEVYFSSPVSILDDLGHAEGADEVIVCDIAVNLPFARPLKNKVAKLRKKTEFVYIDHHPKPPGFNVSWMTHETEACGSLLTYARFRESLDPDLSRVALYGAIGDYRDRTPLALELMKTWDSRSLYYEAGTIAQGIEIGRKDYDHKRDIVVALSKNTLPSQLPALAKNAVTASRMEDELRLRIEKSVMRLKNVSYVIDMDGFISKAAIYAHIYGGTCVGVAAEFLRSKNVYDVSVRAKGDCDLNVLVGEAARRSGGTGGGHPQAAGGRIPAANIMEFINGLDYLLSGAQP